MAILFEYYINENQQLKTSLTNIFGIGKTKSKNICFQIGLQKKCTYKLLQDSHLKKLRQILMLEIIGKRLNRQTKKNISNLIKKKCYRGTRHRNNLPVRGQRTHSNARSQKRR
jgi:small subunit ribosomal protein S13